MNYKISLLGDTGVGKTSLLMQFIENKFEENIERTLNPDKYPYKIDNYNLSFWDSIGQEEYNVFGSINYRNCSLILLVYDINNDSSKERLLHWYKEIRELNEINLPILIIANKIDLLKENKEIIHINDDKNIDYIKISTKNKTNFDDLKSKILKILKTIPIKSNTIDSEIKLNYDMINRKKKIKSKGCC